MSKKRFPFIHILSVYVLLLMLAPDAFAQSEGGFTGTEIVASISETIKVWIVFTLQLIGVLAFVIVAYILIAMLYEVMKDRSMFGELFSKIIAAFIILVVIGFIVVLAEQKVEEIGEGIQASTDKLLSVYG